MPVKGIDEEKCSGCGQCINDCPSLNFSIDDGKRKAVFSPLACMGCGHCIAICPEDAIIYKSMKGEALSFGSALDPSTLISDETMYRLMRAKRSVRQYKKKKIPKEDIEKIIDIMRYAPTGSNIRQLKCLVISNDEKIKTLGNAVSNALKSSMPAAYTGMFDRKKEIGIEPIFFSAPHVLILHSNNLGDNVNAAIAITYGMLYAETLGISSCWNGLSYAVLASSPEVRKEIAGINDKVLAVMTIGYPAVKYVRAPPRPPIRTKGLKDLE